jgi:hypothetical protein
MVSSCSSTDELRGRIEGAEYDMVLVESSVALQRLIAETAPEEVLQLTLAEVEKRHIQRVLASTGGNKTRAARTLGIDTKTALQQAQELQDVGVDGAQAPGQLGVNDGNLSSVRRESPRGARARHTCTCGGPSRPPCSFCAQV